MIFPAFVITVERKVYSYRAKIAFKMKQIINIYVNENNIDRLFD